MKALILAGGRGTRISEESQSRPKPMVEIGGRPILWHIMKIYGAAGINEFIILLGYRGYMIKEYFANYFLHMSDITIDLETDKVEVHQSNSEPWKVTLLDTGLETMTGGRLLRAKHHIGNDDFCFTYGDGVADVDVRDVIAAHDASDALLTLTAVQPLARYGTLSIGDGPVGFSEKPEGSVGWVNGGFFVASAAVLDYIEDDSTVFERGPLERLAAAGALGAFQHHGFWHGMDTLWDKIYLNGLWDENQAPWKLWTD
ncbi:MAG: glucose-1-phosphate cytidylyltransferase [Ilumatobacteraceae bacterium]